MSDYPASDDVQMQGAKVQDPPLHTDDYERERPQQVDERQQEDRREDRDDRRDDDRRDDHSAPPPRDSRPPRTMEPPRRPPNAPIPTPSNVLGVFGLSIRTRESDLQDEFARSGRVEKVVIVYDQRSERSRGFGFVTMGDIADAERAIADLNGMDLHGRRLRVDFSATVRPHDPTPGAYKGEKRDDFGPRDSRGGYGDRWASSDRRGYGGGGRYGGGGYSRDDHRREDSRYGGGDRYGGGGGDRYGGGGRDDRYGGGRDDRYGSSCGREASPPRRRRDSRSPSPRRDRRASPTRDDYGVPPPRDVSRDAW